MVIIDSDRLHHFLEKINAGLPSLRSGNQIRYRWKMWISRPQEQLSLRSKSSLIITQRDLNCIIIRSAIPPSANIPHRPKRPTHTGLSGLDFFGKPIRPAKERSRSRTKTRTPVQLHKNLPQTPIPPVPQLPPLPLSREPEPIRPYEVAFPDESTLPRSMPGPNSQGSAVQAVTGGNDFAKVIATQKQTISRLLDEASYINRTLDRMKTVEDCASFWYLVNVVRFSRYLFVAIL